MDEVTGTALRERGIIVRVSAGTLVAVQVGLLLVGVSSPDAFGLSLGTVLAIGITHLTLNLALAVVPWDRILPVRPMPWLLRATVVYNLGAVLITLLVADADRQLFWLLAFSLLYSALVLPVREHGVAATVAVVAAALIVGQREGVTADGLVDLIALTGLALLATIGSAVVLGALSRAEAARNEADASSSALRDALVAVHSTRTGDVQRILDATAAAAVRRSGDMAGAYLVDDDEVLTAFEGVPEELRRSDPATVRAIVDSIDERGSAVLDYDGADRDALSEDLRGTLRASLVAPVRRRGRVIGAVTVARQEGPLFTSGEQVALELLADHVARGIILSEELASDRAALERLRELDRLKRDFVATVSHEMRTPLTVITGLSETLQERGDGMDDELRATMITRLRSNAATLERIVTGLLDASGIDRGIVKVQQDDIDLTDLLHQTATRIESLFDEHDLVTDVEPGLLAAGDVGLLERVVENLLNNAQRHTPPGTTVRLTGRRDGRSDRVTVEVSDDGPGIAPEDLERVLGRFVRGGSLEERPTRGLGLGLALADEVLRLHNSTLEVESEVGVGTTFRFTLVTVPAPQPVRPAGGS